MFTRTASIIRKDASGAATLYYNDPNGGSYTSTSLLKTIRTLRPDIQLRDLQVCQQSDSTSCGAFTAEDLVVLAKISDEKLTLESARELLSNIKDAQMLRNKHAGIVTQENGEYFEDKEEVFNSPKDKKGSDAEKFRDSLDEVIEEQQVKEAFSKLTVRPKE
ncbi:MAG TPA: hypothetical protein LFV90_06595 [Rickettsia endosymbiont of Columbicola hoogstraali]|nr:hypothetical protein [Rickettsia endosymbiont of Columbicola hoogstraali]